MTELRQTLRYQPGDRVVIKPRYRTTTRGERTLVNPRHANQVFTVAHGRLETHGPRSRKLHERYRLAGIEFRRFGPSELRPAPKEAP